MNDPIMTDMRSEYSKSLIQLGHDNPNVVVLGADTTDSLKTSGFGKQFPERFFNVGIAEANLVTVSAGLAVSGKISFASTYAIFLPGRAVDQIRNNIAYPSPPGKKVLNVKLVTLISLDSFKTLLIPSTLFLIEKLGFSSTISTCLCAAA